MTDASLRRFLPTLWAICLTCSACAPAAADGGAIFLGRMSDRTTVELSKNFFRTKAKDREKDATVETFVSLGLGFLRHDNDRNGEGRICADAGVCVNSGYFQMGSFVACGKSGGPALGARFAAGWLSRSGLFAGGHWEYAAALPGAARGSRAGLGVQAGLRF